MVAKRKRKPRRDTNFEAQGAEFLVLGSLLTEGIVAYKSYVRTRGFDIVASGLTERPTGFKKAGTHFRQKSVRHQRVWIYSKGPAFRFPGGRETKQRLSFKKSGA